MAFETSPGSSGALETICEIRVIIGPTASLQLRSIYYLGSRVVCLQLQLFHLCMSGEFLRSLFGRALPRLSGAPFGDAAVRVFVAAVTHRGGCALPRSKSRASRFGADGRSHR